jgi:hypothetical protein
LSTVVNSASQAHGSAELDPPDPVIAG